jgi:hypothetical protein
MPKTTTKTDRAKLILLRVFEDEEVQGHLRTGVTRLHEAWGRAARRRPSKAVEDKKLWTKAREGATSLAKAGRSLGRKPDPPKRTGRKLVLVAAAAGVVVVVLKKRQGQPAPQAPEPAATASPAPAPEQQTTA